MPSFLVKPYIYGSNLELIHRLEEELHFRGASPVATAAAASAVIELVQVSYLREVRILDLDGTVTGYVLKYEVVYRVIGPNLDIIADDTHITLRRNLDYDRGQPIIALERDETLLRDELVEEVVRRILARLMAL